MNDRRRPAIIERDAHSAGRGCLPGSRRLGATGNLTTRRVCVLPSSSACNAVALNGTGRPFMIGSAHYSTGGRNGVQRNEGQQDRRSVCNARTRRNVQRLYPSRHAARKRVHWANNWTQMRASGENRAGCARTRRSRSTSSNRQVICKAALRDCAELAGGGTLVNAFAPPLLQRASRRYLPKTPSVKFCIPDLCAAKTRRPVRSSCRH
jgi:hypothetical protein